jgi:hypothetical protein
MLDEFELRICAMRSQIPLITRDQVVHHDDMMPITQQTIRQMRTDEAGTTSDENPQ